ncbi:MAG: CoA-binding protein [Deltaproteobacteria bacterium]|nr:CoA-binding protein [Deltaproteobacteria bacterium]
MPPSHHFSPLFHPRSVAVIGASANPLKMGHQCLVSLKEGRFPGALYAVHRQAKELLGVPAYPDAARLPAEVDLAILAVPAREVMAALQACGERGIRGAVVITAGFKEAEGMEGAALQREMRVLADQAGMTVIGPNTFGLVNLHAGLNASFTPYLSLLKAGSISILSQSGGVAHLIAYQALDEGVGLSKIVGLGNRCQVDFADLLPFLAEDAQTRSIILFLEGLENPRPLVRAVEEVSSRKPVIFMKAGRSAEAQQASRSHTGSLAGRYEIYAAALRNAGAVVIDEHRDLLDLARLLSWAQPPGGRRVAVMTFQAGPGILLTDAAVRLGLHMAAFQPDTQRELNRHLPPLTIRTNPVDLIFAGSEQVFEKVMGLILGDPGVDVLVIFLLHHPFMTLERLAPSMIRQRQAWGKPVLLCARGPRGMLEEEAARLEEKGIPFFSLPERTIRALKGLISYGEGRRRERVTENGGGPRAPGLPPDRA